MEEKQTMKLTKQELDAMRINAMLNGLDPNEIKNEQLDEEDIDIEIVDEEKYKKKAKNKSKGAANKSDNAPSNKGLYLVPELKEFAKLNTGLSMNVMFNQHDIHYKDQLWNINSRSLKYNLEPIKHSKRAKDVASLMCKQSKEEIERADKGEVRYLVLINREENVYHMLKEIAYVRVELKDGKVMTQIAVNNKSLKENHADPNKVKKNLLKLVKNIM